MSHERKRSVPAARQDDGVSMAEVIIFMPSGDVLAVGEVWLLKAGTETSVYENVEVRRSQPSDPMLLGIGRHQYRFRVMGGAGSYRLEARDSSLLGGEEYDGTIQIGQVLNFTVP
jgi:hypothetical protein